MERLRTRYFWPKMREGVLKHLKACQICDSAKPKKETPAPVRPMPVPKRPNARISADTWGPHRDADGKPKYVVIVTDALTKLIYMRVQDSNDATETAKTLLNWCLHYGIPEEIITDGGPEYCGKVMTALWDLLKVRHRTTTPFHPRSNGQSEVQNRKVNSYLRKLVSGSGLKSGTWPEFIPALQMSHNTSIHAGIRTSPFEAMFGYTPNSAFWPNMEDIVHPNPDPVEKDALARLRNDREEIRDTARDMLYAQQDLMLQANERARTARPRWRPTNGETVWVMRHDINVPNPSLEQMWEKGIVLHPVTPNTYKVNRINRKRHKVRTLNIQQLRPCVNDIPQADDNLRTEQAEDDPGLPQAAAALDVLVTRAAKRAIWQATEAYRRNRTPFSVTLSHLGLAGAIPPPLPALPPARADSEVTADSESGEYEDAMDDDDPTDEDEDWEARAPSPYPNLGLAEEALHYPELDFSRADAARAHPLFTPPRLHPPRRPAPPPPPCPPPRRMATRSSGRALPPTLPADAHRELRELVAQWPNIYERKQ